MARNYVSGVDRVKTVYDQNLYPILLRLLISPSAAKITQIYFKVSETFAIICFKFPSQSIAFLFCYLIIIIIFKCI